MSTPAILTTRLKEERDYWVSRVSGEIGNSNLALDFKRLKVYSKKNETAEIELPAEVAQRLVAFTNDSPFLIYTTLMAALKICLHHYTGSGTIVVGSPSYRNGGTPRENNVLPIIDHLDEGLSFRQVLINVRETLSEAYARQDYPFRQLIRDLGIEEDETRCPLFDIILVYEEIHADLPEVRNDITLRFRKESGTLTGSIEFNARLFRRETVERFARHLVSAMRATLNDNAALLRSFALLTVEDRDRLWSEWNNVNRDYAADACLNRMFETQVERTPEGVAVVYDDAGLTYRELNARANQVAHDLRRLGVGPESIIGICLDRSLEMIIGLLGILKAGGAYLPLDPAYPETRLAFMLDDARAPVLLTWERYREKFSVASATVICLDSDWERISRESRDNPRVGIDPENPAYVLFTSGSTGQPKGVVMSRRPLANLVSWQMENSNTSGGAKTLQFATLSFDVSFQEIFSTLCAGETLVMISEDLRRDPANLWRRLGEEAVERLFLPFIYLQQLADAVVAGSLNHRSLREVITAGEQLQITPSIIELFRRLPGCLLVNQYGPTESHVVSAFTLDGAPTRWPLLPSIGRPVANARLYLLDRHLQPVPVGVVSELYLSGISLARCYLNRAELSAERFIPHPYGREGGERLYKTGDLGRYLPDGCIEYLGRVDGQVKIRGFRVEVGEIEVALSKHPAVKECVVVAREDTPGAKRLVAYAVTNQEPQPSNSELRRFFKERLPEYMIPSAFVFLDTLPLTRTGKIDRLALPAPKSGSPEVGSVTAEPRTPAEELLARIWVEVLGVDQVGIYDNFFELGGDSILAIQVVARANRAGLRLIPKQLFQRQTIAGLAAVADTAPRAQAEQGDVSGPVLLTPIQHWLFEQELTDVHHFNMGYLFEWRAEEPSTPSLIERTFSVLLAHHDALRLRFVRTSDGWRQTNAAAIGAGFFTSTDLSDLSEPEQSRAIETLATSLQSSLDLSAGPLARVALFNLGGHKAQRLLIIVHHLAIDGMSWRILVEDFHTVYRQLQAGEPVNLPPKTTSFRQWSERLTAHAQSNLARQELAYWLAEPAAPFVPLPINYTEGSNFEASASVVTVSLGTEETEALLRDVPKFQNLRINDVLLAALAQTFAGWTGSRSLLVDLESHGREEIGPDLDVSRTVGWFTSISPVWLDLSEAQSLAEVLATVKEQLRRIPNRGIGYGLLRYLDADNSSARQLRALPKAQVSFNYLGQVDQMFTGTSLLGVLREPIGPVIAPSAPMPHLLYIAGIIFQGQLLIRFKYSSDSYRRSTIELLAQRFQSELQALIQHCRSAEPVHQAGSLFPLARLEQEELSRFFDQVRVEGAKGAVTAERVENVYPLSPSQEGILFHSIYAPESGVYVIQMHCTFRGLDVQATERAWQALLDRYPILRSAFVWDQVEKPLQVVVKNLRVPWQKLDWRGVAPDELAKRYGAYLEEDRNRGFELSIAPLMRFSLIRTGDEEYQFVWSHHHLLLDGWSIFIILKEFLFLYDADVKGKPVRLAPAQPYSDYIAWLQSRSHAEAEPFWREMLKGFTGPTSLGGRSENGSRRSDGHGEYRLSLSETTTSALHVFARQHQLTLNTVVQGAWALVLSHYGGVKDVVFGATASGRPPELPGVELMVGIFINVLPMRVKLEAGDPVHCWLKRIQEEQFKVRQYEYSPLVQIQRWSEAPRGLPLFESILSFENYPVNNSIREYAGDLEISGVQSISRTNYPITVVVAPRGELILRLVYDLSRFDPATIEEMATHFSTVLRSFVDRPEATVSSMEEILADAQRSRKLSEQKQQEEIKRSKFKRINPKVVRLPQELVKTSGLSEEEPLPLVIEPAVENLNLAEWARHNLQMVETKLYSHGAILFRGFDVDSVEGFQQVAAAICPELFDEYGDLPRESVNGKVYGSTPYPSAEMILYHNESSHLHRWPMKIWFYCVQAAREGGETPIVDGRRIYQRLDPVIRRQFERKKLMYVRNYVEGLDVSWQSFFRTDNRTAVEEYCRKAGIEYTWLDSGGLRTRQVCPAVARHPRTEEAVFFNQFQLHHASCLAPAVRETLGSLFSIEDFPRHAYYGDGSPIEDSLVSEIRELYRQNAVAFPWREGDILMLDNMLTAHARNPFVGPRKIVVAMGDIMTECELLLANARGAEP